MPPLNDIFSPPPPPPISSNRILYMHHLTDTEGLFNTIYKALAEMGNRSEGRHIKNDDFLFLTPSADGEYNIDVISGSVASPKEHKEGRKEMFYLTTHSTHFIYGYMASDIW